MAELATPKIRIRMKAFDHKLLDMSASEILDTCVRTGSRTAGPIPLPTSIVKFTVLRGPHVDKKSREQFEIRTHRRLIDILDPTLSLEGLHSIHMNLSHSRGGHA
mgnify:CR=1 FL=1